jgi:hypothetical protein
VQCRVLLRSGWVLLCVCISIRLWCGAGLMGCALGEQNGHAAAPAAPPQQMMAQPPPQMQQPPMQQQMYQQPPVYGQPYAAYPVPLLLHVFDQRSWCTRTHARVSLLYG